MEKIIDFNTYVDLIKKTDDYKPHDDGTWVLYFRQFDNPRDRMYLDKACNVTVLSNCYSEIYRGTEKDTKLLHREISKGTWYVYRNRASDNAGFIPKIPFNYLFISEQIGYGNPYCKGSYADCYDFLEKNSNIAYWAKPKLEDLRPTMTIKEILESWVKGETVQVKEYFDTDDSFYVQETDWRDLTPGSQIFEDKSAYQYRLKPKDPINVGAQRIKDVEEYIVDCKTGKAINPLTFEPYGHPIEVNEAEVWKNTAIYLADNLDKMIEKAKEHKENGKW